MIASIFVLLLAWILPVSSIKKSISSEEIIERLECIGYCHKKFHRSCQVPPHLCGDCMHSYFLDEGICIKKDSLHKFGRIITLETSTSADFSVLDYKRDEQVKEMSSKEENIESNTTGSFHTSKSNFDRYWDIMLIAVLSSISLILIVAIISTLICMCRSHKEQDRNVPYQTFYGDAKGSSALNGDRKLAYSAQMYHYQYQKQQMLANEKSNGYDQKNMSGNSTDEEILDDDEEAVYGYKGPAADEELEVTNPSFCEYPPPPSYFDANDNKSNINH